MKVLEHEEVERSARMIQETEGTKVGICHWVDCDMICDNCPVFEYKEEAAKCFPDGLTYDEAKDYLEGK